MLLVKSIELSECLKKKIIITIYNLKKYKFKFKEWSKNDKTILNMYFICLKILPTLY